MKVAALLSGLMACACIVAVLIVADVVELPTIDVPFVVVVMS